MKKEMKVKTQTRSLSYYELNVLLPILLKGLEMKKGKKNAVTREQIIVGLKKQGLKISGSPIDRLIHYIRTNDLIEGLVGSLNGFYVSESEQEYIEYEKTLLAREVSLRKVRMSIQRQRRSMYSEHSQILNRQTQLF